MHEWLTVKSIVQAAGSARTLFHAQRSISPFVFADSEVPLDTLLPK